MPACPAHVGQLDHRRASFTTQDARQWAQWGVDYLKYDWFPNDVPHVKEMTDALRSTDRDIVYSLSNTGLYDSAADYTASRQRRAHHRRHRRYTRKE